MRAWICSLGPRWWCQYPEQMEARTEPPQTTELVTMEGNPNIVNGINCGERHAELMILWTKLTNPGIVFNNYGTFHRDAAHHVLSAGIAQSYFILFYFYICAYKWYALFETCGVGGAFCASNKRDSLVCHWQRKKPGPSVYYIHWLHATMFASPTIDYLLKTT